MPKELIQYTAPQARIVLRRAKLEEWQDGEGKPDIARLAQSAGVTHAAVKWILDNPPKPLNQVGDMTAKKHYGGEVEKNDAGKGDDTKGGGEDTSRTGDKGDAGGAGGKLSRDKK